MEPSSFALRSSQHIEQDCSDYARGGSQIVQLDDCSSKRQSKAAAKGEEEEVIKSLKIS